MPVTDIYLKMVPFDPEPSIYKIVQRSYGPNNRLQFHLVQADGVTPYNIGTSYPTPYIQMILYRFDRIPYIFKVATLDSLSGGTCHYDPITGDFIINRTRFYWLRISLQDGNPGTNQEISAETLIEVV